MKKRGLAAEEERENPESLETQQRNQRPKFSIPTWCLFKEGWLQEPFVQAMLENKLRKVVREVTEPMVLHHLQTNPRSLANEAEPSKSRKFKLHFDGQLPRKLYTGNSIEAEGSSPLKVKLLDALSGDIVTDGPLSSAKVKIVALHGHFKVETLDGWSQKDFNDNIVPPRDDKGPLLVGGCVIMCNGIGFVKGISFTDNSSWVRSKMFRLGAKIELNMAKEDQVREAVSCPFKVKHRRGETYQKHSTPSQKDEVWRLQGISKDGKIHERLKKHQIYKVEDLLQQYHTNQSSLRDIIRSSKAWKEIVQQVTTLFPSNEYAYLSDWPPSLVATDAILPSTNPFSAAVASQDQPGVQMRNTHGMEPRHALGHSITPNLDASIDNSLMIEELLAKPYDDGPNWFYLPQSTSGQATNTSFGGLLSSITNLGVSTSKTAKPKRRFWSKVRAVWKLLLVKCGAAALKKGKFPCISY